MTKLYELLAVEPDLRSSSNDITKEIAKLFRDGLSRFKGSVISVHKLLDDLPEVPAETVALATSVDRELKRLADAFGGYVDVSIQKEISNAGTSGTVSLDGKTFLENVPATALLNLENRLVELRKVYESIPVLDPSEKWDYDEQSDCYVSEDRITFRTKKVPQSHTLAPATPEHPAQVEMYYEDVPAYRVETQNSSGALTLRDKRERLARIDKLYRAVKEARQRANDAEASDTTVAEKIFEYINNWE